MNSTYEAVSSATSNQDLNSFTEHKMLPRMAIDEELNAYKIMQSSALCQLILFTETPYLLSLLKELVENISYETERNAKTSTPEEDTVYLELLSLIDELEILHHIGDITRLQKRHRRLQRKLSEWPAPRHLVMSAIKKIMTSRDYTNASNDDTHLKKVTTKQFSRYLQQRNRLVSANLRLVLSIAKRFRYLGLPYEDLIQEGSLGLIKAIERFNPKKGFLFSTYAYRPISQTIHFAIEQHSSTVRKPNTLMRDKAVVDQTRARLEQSLSRPPRSFEFEQSLPSTIEKKSAHIALNIQPTADSESYHMLPSCPELHPQMDRTKQDFQTHFLKYKDLLDTALSHLDKRTLQIVRMRFGIGINRTYTLKEIGETLSISTERARQISVKAIETLQLMYQTENKH
ncbi:MAG: RNA polymerase sigma factor (sigma-70 family) [Oleiphilaceae bacterium]|jgi:RNA polymerase sigma factor (sigma-70 family)